MLVHCSQGVSRSAALAIAFLMWQSQRPYEQVFAEVKAIRGIANPNIGFTCQVRSFATVGDQCVRCLNHMFLASWHGWGSCARPGRLAHWGKQGLGFGSYATALNILPACSRSALP